MIKVRTKIFLSTNLNNAILMLTLSSGGIYIGEHIPSTNNPITELQTLGPKTGESEN